jgi:hypothetical protein
MYPRFTSVDSGHVWLPIRGYINQLCGHTPTDLRMGAPMPTTNSVGLLVTLTETQRKAAVCALLRHKTCFRLSFKIKSSRIRKRRGYAVSFFSFSRAVILFA